MIEKLRKSYFSKGEIPINSVIRACKILECLSNNVNSIKEISQLSGLSMSTVHRILQTLEGEGLAYQSPVDHKYYLGPLFTKLPLNQVIAHQHLIINSVDETNRLWDLFGECTALDIELGLQVISLIEKQSRFNYSLTRLSHTVFYGSLSKVLMAQKSDADIELILNSVTPKPLTKHCVTDRKKLAAEFRKVRQQGYSVSRMEIIEGIMGISVPIYGYLCAAGLSIVGPEIRLNSITDKAIEEMKKSAQRISERIIKGIDLT